MFELMNGWMNESHFQYKHAKSWQICKELLQRNAAGTLVFVSNCWRVILKVYFFKKAELILVTWASLSSSLKEPTGKVQRWVTILWQSCRLHQYKAARHNRCQQNETTWELLDEEAATSLMNLIFCQTFIWHRKRKKKCGVQSHWKNALN